MENTRLATAALCALLIYGCHKDDDITPTELPANEQHTITVNVDVILPTDIRDSWQPTIDWAMTNISKAQEMLPNQINLRLRYHDEDAEDLDRLAYTLTHPAEGDDTCHAIIGPYHSSNANTILRYAERNRLPVIMPTCTSAELQRTNARSTYAWFLTESDITQCEMMIALAANNNFHNIALIYSDDTYGHSFRDWFGYYAAEQQLHLAGDGVCAFKDNDDITPFLNSFRDDCTNQKVMICCALSNAADYAKVCKQINQLQMEVILDDNNLFLYTLFADVAFDPLVIDDMEIGFSYAIAPYGSPTYGFPQAYEARYGSLALGGYAQIYDALTLTALGAAHQAVHGENCLVDGKQVVYDTRPTTPGLTDHIRSIVACENGAATGWNLNGLTRAFAEIAGGREITITGATGTFNFDGETRTKILNTTYLVWDSNFENDGTGNFYRMVKPLVYLSTEGSSTQASTTTLWQMDKRWNSTIEDVTVSHNLPALTDRWAVVISPSTSWSNYRHQADAFAMYQTLKHSGYDDDHIILIVEDNLANDPLNLYPGKIFVERSNDAAATSDIFVNDNVRENVVVDYHFSDLTPDDLADIMLGRSNDRLPQVIHPSSSSDVFFFWSGHGGSIDGPLWGNEDASKYFGKQRIKDIVTEMNSLDKYRRMMFAIETCYSGKWGEVLEGLPDVLVLTAATAYETSKADIYDRSLGVYLSNAFARTFRRQIYQNPHIAIYDLYRELFKTTKGSHVSIYNQLNYGSVYDETMGEFLE